MDIGEENEQHLACSLGGQSNLSGNYKWYVRNFIVIKGGCKMLKLVWKDQKYQQWTELHAIVPTAIVLDHEDQEKSHLSIPNNHVGLQRCVHAGFLQNDGAGMVWIR